MNFTNDELVLLLEALTNYREDLTNYWAKDEEMNIDNLVSRFVEQLRDQRM